jgi:hypothetical protein
MKLIPKISKVFDYKMIAKMFIFLVASNFLSCSIEKTVKKPVYDSKKLHRCLQQAYLDYNNCLDEADRSYIDCKDHNREIRKENRIKSLFNIGFENCLQFHPKCDNDYKKNKEECLKTSLMNSN